MTGHPVPTSHRTRHLGLPDSWEGGSAGFICPSACLRYSPIRHRPAPAARPPVLVAVRFRLRPEVSGTACLHYPACYRRHGEVSDNPNQHKDDVDTVRVVYRVVRIVLQFLNVILKHQYLKLGKQGAEQVADRKPQVNGNISREPLSERGLESVPYTEGERYLVPVSRVRPGKKSSRCLSAAMPLRISAPAGCGMRPGSSFPDYTSRLPHTCPAGRRYLWLTSQFIQLNGQTPRHLPDMLFRIAEHGLLFQFLLLVPVLFHIHRLPFEHLCVCPARWD